MIVRVLEWYDAVSIVAADPERFWKSLQASDALRLLQCAPKIVAPWVRNECDQWIRHRLDGGDAASVVALGDGGWRWAAARNGGTVVSTYPTDGTDEAKQSADAALRSAGWLLVDTESEGE
jgi:hypothetical protein